MSLRYRSRLKLSCSPKPSAAKDDNAGMGDFVVSREPVPDWRNPADTPVRPMADQIGDVLEQFDDQKDFPSIVALTQGMRAVDQRFSTDDTIDKKEWEVVRRAMRKALGDPKAPIANRAERISKAFDEETKKA